MGYFCLGGPDVDFEEFDLRILRVRTHCRRRVIKEAEVELIAEEGKLDDSGLGAVLAKAERY